MLNGYFNQMCKFLNFTMNSYQPIISFFLYLEIFQVFLWYAVSCLPQVHRAFSWICDGFVADF